MLRNLVETSYPNLSPENINALIPNKSEMNQVKAMAHGGRTLMIYCSNLEPIFFLLENRLYPSIYTLWKHLDLLPTIATVPPVLEKICNGADLMAPGVVISDAIIKEMKNLKTDDVCAIRIFGNKAPIAIGIALMSLDNLCTDGIKGKAVSVVHNYKDFLWSSGSSIDLPIVAEEIIDEMIDDICDETGNIDIAEEATISNSEDVKNEGDAENSVENDCILAEEVENKISVMPTYTMDEILYQSFMAAIKSHGKKIQLPLLTSTFYSTYVLKSCPPELTLDIKKTSYKKLSVFLKKMSKEGILQIKELTKGVESIVSFNLENETVKTFFLDQIFRKQMKLQKVEKSKEDDSSTSTIQENYKFPAVLELFVISAQVKKVFEAAKMKYVVIRSAHFFLIHVLYKTEIEKYFRYTVFSFFLNSMHF